MAFLSVVVVIEEAEEELERLSPPLSVINTWLCVTCATLMRRRWPGSDGCSWLASDRKKICLSYLIFLHTNHLTLLGFVIILQLFSSFILLHNYRYSFFCLRCLPVPPISHSTYFSFLCYALSSQQSLRHPPLSSFPPQWRRFHNVFNKGGKKVTPLNSSLAFPAPLSFPSTFPVALTAAKEAAKDACLFARENNVVVMLG